MVGTEIVVTGGCGRIGRKLVERLVREGNDVKVIDTKAGHIEGVHYLTSPISDIKKIKADIIYHLAASVDYKASRDELRERNIAPTAHLLRLCQGCRQFIFLSTSSVYGASDKPLSEETTPKPYTDYGWSKLECERLVRASGLPYTIIRSSQVYGPDFEAGYKTFLQLVQNGSMRIFGSGDNFIPLIHINDLVDALMLVKGKSSTINQLFNADGDYRKTQNDLMRIAADAMGAEPPASHVSPVLAKLNGKLTGKSSFVNEYIDKLTKNRMMPVEKIRAIGFEPKIGLEPGIKGVVEAFRARGLIK